MNYFIVAGEASGDLHGANLAKALHKVDNSANINAWGGQQLINANATVTKDYKELAIMGFVEIISQLPKIIKNLNTATNEIIDHQTDAVILIDFSGFNLRLAKRLRKKGFKGKIFYYISPKLWIWNAKRVNSFKKYIDAVFTINYRTSQLLLFYQVVEKMRSTKSFLNSYRLLIHLLIINT